MADDNYRLIKLVSLVGWTHPAGDPNGLRFASDADRERLTDDEQAAGEKMCAYYADAVEDHRRKVDVADDAAQRRFPEVTLAFVTNLSVDAVAVLGEMVRRSLDLDQVNPAVLGRRWVDDVLATCWRLALATHEDRFGPAG